MTFGEFCREYYRQENGIEIPDWQVDNFDQYYKEFRSRGPDQFIKFQRGNGKTNMAFHLIMLLNAYLEEENGK